MNELSAGFEEVIAYIYDLLLRVIFSLNQPTQPVQCEDWKNVTFVLKCTYLYIGNHILSNIICIVLLLQSSENGLVERENDS